MERALLPWEDAGEFRDLLAGVRREHKPVGATEAALTDQLAWIEWRGRRLQIGERAAHLAAIEERVGDNHRTRRTLARAMLPTGGHCGDDELRDSMRTGLTHDQAELADIATDERMTRQAIRILESGDPEAYRAALEALHSDTRDWWEAIVAEDEGADDAKCVCTAESLMRFLVSDVLRQMQQRRREIANRPSIRLQVQGESLDPFRMDRILALDERLTRQVEKTLAMLLKLQDLRRTAQPATSPGSVSA
jgi:hypothetical protein